MVDNDMAQEKPVQREHWAKEDSWGKPMFKEQEVELKTSVSPAS